MSHVTMIVELSNVELKKHLCRPATKACRTRADKIKISVELVKILVKKSVLTNSNDTFQSVRLLTILHLKIRYHF